MADKTMTRSAALLHAIAALSDSNVPEDVEAVAVLTKMNEQITKPKAKAEGTKSKTQLENEAAAKHLYEVATDEPFDTKFVMLHTIAMTPQKAVGIMNVGIKQLGLFERIQDGKKVLYRKLG